MLYSIANRFQRGVGLVVAMAVIAIPVVAQLAPCFDKCHTEAMEYVLAGGSERYAEHAIFWPCLEDC